VWHRDLLSKPARRAKSGAGRIVPVVWRVTLNAGLNGDHPRRWAAFNVQRRMADRDFSQATTWAELPAPMTTGPTGSATR
jgi:hypothetical protein